MSEFQDFQTSFKNHTAAAKPIDAFWESIEWLNESLKVPASCGSITHAQMTDFSGNGGLSGAGLNKIKLDFQDGSSQTFVFKTISNSRHKFSSDHGLPRESIFYERFSVPLREVGVSLPSTLFAHGDMAIRSKDIIMENLSECIQSGYFYGDTSPLNWKKDLAALTGPADPNGVYAASGDELALVVTRKAFNEAAKIHRYFWMDQSLLTTDNDWLRCCQWQLQQGQSSWQTSQATAVNNWASTKLKIESGTTSVAWNPLVVACMEASFSRISWENFQSALKARAWTLVHGDFHPANLMWRPSSTDDPSDGQAILLDWEMVGFGSGPQG